MITPFSAWWIGRGAPGVQGYRGVCRTRRGAGGYVLTLPSVLLLLRTGVGLPPYRGRTVRGTVRFNPRRSHLDSCAPARVEQSGGLFDQIQSEATLILSGFSGKAGGKAPGASAKIQGGFAWILSKCPPDTSTLDSGDSLRTLRSSHSTRHVVARCCRLQLFLCLVVENWIMWG